MSLAIQSNYSQINFDTVKESNKKAVATNIEAPQPQIISQFQPKQLSYSLHRDFLSGLVKQSVTNKLAPSTKETSQVKVETRFVKPESKLSKWANISNNTSTRVRKFAEQVEENSSPLSTENLKAAIAKLSESQASANELLSTVDGQAQISELRKQILLGQEAGTFGTGEFPAWEAKLKLMVLEPNYINQIRLANDDDSVAQLPIAKLAHIAIDFPNDSDPAISKLGVDTRQLLYSTTIKLVQSQQDSNEVMYSSEGQQAIEAMKYLILHHEEEKVLGALNNPGGWDAKVRLMLFKPSEIERIRNLGSPADMDEYDQVKQMRALTDGAKIVSTSRISKGDKLQIVGEFTKMMFDTPGKKLGIFGSKVGDGRSIDDVRKQNSPSEYATASDGSRYLKTADFASDPQGRQFDPYQFLPNIVFQNGEDALPIDPVFDGDASPDNNVFNYAHGAIGGDQPLKANVSFYEKDGYVVAQYGFYYADNKAGDYHKHDWHTTSVYLKYNSDTGSYEPKYLYNSWHFGGIMTKWSDLQLDNQGHPTVLVGLGSHSARPLGVGASIPSDFSRGVTIHGGDGMAVNTASGASYGEQLSFFTTQDNVAQATKFNPEGSAQERTRAGIYYYWQEHRHNPYPPSLFGLK